MRCGRISECELDHCPNGHHTDNSGPCLECAIDGMCDRCGFKIHEGLSCDEAAEVYAHERAGINNIPERPAIPPPHKKARR